MRFLPPGLLALALLCSSCGGDPGPAEGTGEGAGRAPAEPRKPAPAWDLAAPVQRRTLLNGLTVLIREKHSAPVVTCQLAFKVGAVDERDGERGLAHFLEHMLFKGSTSYRVGDIDLLTKKVGGWNNAYTTRDMTAYHFTLPSSGLDTALDILKEMLGQSTLDETEFESEKGPVLNELRAGRDDPWDRLWEEVQAKAYGVHPYRHPVIGYEPEIKAMKRGQMKGFYDKYYKPANAVLVIVGDVDTTETFRKVEAGFAGIARGTPVPELGTVEPPQEREIRFENSEDVEVDRLIMAWRGPKAGTPDDYVLDVASAVLGSGRTARLHQRLVEKDRLASSAGTSNYSGRFPGTFTVEVEALPGADRAKIEAAIDEELRKLAAEGPTREELEKARNGVMASFIYRAESSDSLADLIATYACTMTLEDLGRYVERLEKVTGEDVKSVAARTFRSTSRTVGWSVAGGEGGGGGGGGGKRSVAGPRRGAKDPAPARAGGSASLAAARRTVLDNGLTLLVLESRDLPIVSVQTFTRASQLYESEEQAGLSNLVGLLLEDGTATRTAEQIAAAMEYVGGRLETGPAGVEATTLTRDSGLALEIVFDILRNAAFPEERLAQRRDQVLAEIASSREQPRDVARQEFNNLVYGRHPLHRPALGFEPTVKSLTRDDCLRHYRRFFVPNNTLVAIVGDVDAEQVAARVKELTESWKRSPVEFPAFPEAVKPAAGRRRGIPFPESGQVNLFAGHLGVRRSDPDWYALLVMDNIFGTGSGFTDRLSRKIRDKMGLAYAVWANVSGNAGVEPGSFRMYVGCRPEDLAAARKALLEELDRIRTEPVTAEELRAAQDYLTGSFALEMETNAQRADMLVMVERFGLGLDYPAAYAAKVRAVTVEDVKRVAAEHLDPAALFLVAAGPVDEAGEVVEKKEK